MKKKKIFYSISLHHTQITRQSSQPYIAAASASLLKNFVHGFHNGITVTCPGFYGPQGRVLRLGLVILIWWIPLQYFRYGNYRIVNFEMETSAIYGLGKLLGHHCLSLNTVVANRMSKQFSKNAVEAIEKLIQRTLEIIIESI